jgi:site-specific recombinase XerC
VGLQDARAAASGYRAAVAEGADPALVKSVAKKVETVDQMLDRFLTDHSAPGPRWKAEMRRVLAHDVRPAIGAYKINKVCKADIIALLNTIRDRGAGVQANRALQVVRKAFNWAASEDYLTDSPASGIAERVKEEPRSRALSKAEIQAFWRGLDSTGAVYIRHNFAAEKRHALEAWAAELERIAERSSAANVISLRTSTALEN